MHSLPLAPAATALFMLIAGLLLALTGAAAGRLGVFRRGPAVLRADRLLLAIFFPLAIAVAITTVAVTCVADDLLAFQHMPHFCLDRTMASSVGKTAVFVVETSAMLVVLAAARQVLHAVRLFRCYQHVSGIGVLPLSPKMSQAVERLRGRPDAKHVEFREVALPTPTAFLVGALHPRCVIARSLIERLAPAEVEAVLAHEEAHVRRGDLVAKWVVFTCGRVFGFLPPVRTLLHAWEEAAELATDDLAVQRTGCRLELAGALLAAARGASRPAAALVDGSPALLVHRIERLLESKGGVDADAWQRCAGLFAAASLAGGVAYGVTCSPLLPSLHCFVENLVRHF